MYRNRYLSNIGATLAGRDALAMRGLMSSDDSLTWIESGCLQGVYGAIAFVGKSENPDIVNGIKCSPLGKAFVDYMEYPYDDSALTEALELLNPEEKQELDRYILDKNKIALCKDSRWSANFKEILQGRLAHEVDELRRNFTGAIENRELKDLLAAMHRLHFYYPEGIKKQELLDLTAKVDKDCLRSISIEDMEHFCAQVKPFPANNSPRAATGGGEGDGTGGGAEGGEDDRAGGAAKGGAKFRSLTEYISDSMAYRYISDFFSLLSGLTDEGMPGNYRFQNSGWFYEKAK